MGVIAEEAVRIRADTAGFHSEVSRGVISSVGGVAARAAAIFGGIQLGKGLFNATIKSAADFQTTLKVLQATTHASNADLGRLSATAVKLGADARLPATSAKSAADAMLQLGRAGFSTNQTIAATRGVLLLSTAAQIDNATSADMVSKAIGAFGLRAKDANTVVNDFAGAANASQSSLNDVGQAVTQAGAGFHALRIPVSDAATAIAEMAKQGITGGMAGSALNTAFTRLATPTKAAKNVMQEMGVQLFDNNGKFVGLRSAIEQMSPRLAKMTDQQRLSTLSVLGGTRGMKALADVLGVGVKNWDATRAAVTRAGQAQKIADAQTAGFNGAMLALQNTLGTLALKIGIAVLPQVTNLVRWLGRIAAAPSFNVAIKIVWTGIKEFTGNVASALNDALFGSSHIVHIGGHSTGVEVDPGLIANITAAISAGIDATDWSAVGKNVGDKISAAIQIGNDAIAKAVDGLLTALDNQKSRIADIGLVIGLTMVSKLLDPSFWIAHWQLIGGIALSAAAVMFPEGRLAEIGLRAMGFLLKPFELLGSRLVALGTKAVGDFAISMGVRFGPVAGVITKGIGDAIVAATAGAVRFMVDMGAKLIAAIINKISSLGVVFRTAMFTAIVGVIGSLIGAAVGKAVDLAVGVARAILSTPGRLAAFVGSMTSHIVGALTRIAGEAATAALNVANRIAAAIKTAPDKLAGLAGDISGRIRAAASQAAGSAFSAMRQVGFSIADGVLSGIGNLASRIASAVGGAAAGAVGGAMSFIKGKSPSRLYADTVGKSIGDGVTVGAVEALGGLGPGITPVMVEELNSVFATAESSVNAGVRRMQSGLGKIGDRLGVALVGLQSQMATKFDPLIEEISNAAPKAAAKLITKAKAVEKPIQDAFVAWIGRGKAAFDAKSAALIATVDATFTKAQAKIDAWKAKATPTEALIAQRQAQAAEAAVVQAVADANAALGTLRAKFDADWANLLASQAANMQKLRAQQGVTVTDTAIAGHEFNKQQAATASDPLAQTLVAADKTLIAVKARYAAGTATLEELNAAVDDFDAAQLAAQDDANATKLLEDYTTWQNLVAQTAEGNAAINAQIVTDQQAQQGLIDQYNTDKLTADATLNNALVAQQDYYLGVQAEQERVARDAEAVRLNAALVARHDRIVAHLKEIIHAHDIHFDELARMAAKAGGTVGENLAKAMRDSIPLVDSAAQALAQTVKRYLKTGSPTEAGPMSDLNTWWTNLTPTLLQSFNQTGLSDALSAAVTPSTSSMSIGSGGAAAYNQGMMNTDRMEALLQQIEKHTAATADKPDTTEVHVATGAVVTASAYRSRR